jgi:uncharacterized ion transporter superfamily protein YfcC
MKFFEAITSQSTAKLVFFILFIGGAFEIIIQTGSIVRVFERTLVLFRKKRILIIPLFITLFSVLGFTMGLSTASVIFVPIGILAARMLGFDLLTGTAMVALGTNAGFAAGIYNPFSVGIAQTIAEVPLYSGAWIRWLLLVFLISVTSIYIVCYAKRYDSLAASDQFVIQYEKTDDMVLGFTHQKDTGIEIEMGYKPITIRQKLVLLLFIASFVIVTYGISAWKWEIQEIGVLFLITGIVCGFAYGFEVNRICDIFLDGCKKMLKGVFVIGLAATLRLVLSDGNILDTIAYNLTGFARYFPNWAKLMGMFYGNAALDLMITSGSAHASIAMPIMLPMSDFLGLSRQSAVFAFQLGDGLVNLTSPISTTLTGILAVSGISYGKWIRFFLPLVGIYMVIGSIFILLAGGVGY